MKSLAQTILVFCVLSAGGFPRGFLSLTQVAAAAVLSKPQLNVSILLDLSDRIVRPGPPSQKEKDLEIIKAIANIFKKEMSSKGALLAKGKIRVLFSPSPPTPEINRIAKKLSIDLSEMKPKRKKEIYNSILTVFQ